MTVIRATSGQTFVTSDLEAARNEYCRLEQLGYTETWPEQDSEDLVIFTFAQDGEPSRYLFYFNAEGNQPLPWEFRPSGASRRDEYSAVFRTLEEANTYAKSQRKSGATVQTLFWEPADLVA